MPLVQVLRWENSNGEGPWTADNGRPYVDASLMPSVRTDVPGFNEGMDICGVLPDQNDRWFTQRDRRILSDFGFQCTTYLLSIIDVKFGDNQVGFDRSHVTFTA